MLLDLPEPALPMPSSSSKLHAPEPFSRWLSNGLGKPETRTLAEYHRKWRVTRQKNARVRIRVEVVSFLRSLHR
jgi:hypothetical protein